MLENEVKIVEISKMLVSNDHQSNSLIIISTTKITTQYLCESLIIIFSIKAEKS